jgi:hypothetical protein
MLKRTKGYLLLTMLVLTGLAGKLHTETLSVKERRILLHEVKEAKSAFLETTNGLSKKQLNYRKAKGLPSVKDYIFQAVSVEKNLLSSAKTALKEPGVMRKNMLSDDCLPQLIKEDSKRIYGPVSKFRNVDEAFTDFREESTTQLKYIRTTTENVRLHSAQLQVCRLDAYQLMLLSALAIQDFTQKINALKTSRGFPKQ